MAEIKKTQISGISCYFPEFYVAMEKQIKNARRLVRENPNWGFNEWDVPSDIPSLEDLGPTEFWVISFYLPRRGSNSSTLMTLGAHLKVINKQTPIYTSKKPAVRACDAKLYRRGEQPAGIYWKIVDYASGFQGENLYDGISETRIKNPVERLASSEVFSALMLMPKWYKFMNGIDIPYVFMPGYQVCSDGISLANSHWNYVTYASPRMAISKSKTIDDRIDIGKTKDHNPKPGWACCLVR